jgi:hypothetical protein
MRRSAPLKRPQRSRPPGDVSPGRDTSRGNGPPPRAESVWHGECTLQSEVPDRSASLREAILDYLTVNPNAAETAEGVKRVWLGRIDDRITAEEVELVLNDLVRAERLEKHELPGGGVMYRGGLGT